MRIPPSKELIQRSLVGDTSEEEARSVYEYFSATEQQKGIFLGIKDAIQAEDIAGPPSDSRQSLAMLMDRMQQEEKLLDGNKGKNRGTRGGILRRSNYAFASIAVVLLAISLFSEVSVLSLWRGGRLGLDAGVREYTTHRGQRAKVYLPDGSAVLLNSDSRISFATDFGKSSRTVELIGEALFTVTRQSGTPFIVRTSDIDTRVLGTVFSVQRYTEDTVTRVIVAQGKVSASETLLTAGQAAIGKSDGSSARDQNVDVAAVLGWTTGKLSIQYQLLSDIIPQLERWFDIDIQIADKSLLNKRINIAFENETPRQALELISEIVNAKAHWNDKTVTLNSP